ncbi:methyl-accepting chemotaxis protein [Desertibaculum subflavum]|uniref:methyl-accepting chemotaxis protein n=1 Tax=Desertibaculum subflavum TaxID=2268458 RepID=UPI000E6610B0
MSGLPRLRLGVGGRLQLGVGAVAATTLIAGVVGWTSLATLESGIQAIGSRELPTVAGTLALGQQAATLAASAPALAGAQTKADHEAEVANLRLHIEAMRATLGGISVDAKQAIEAAIGTMDGKLKELADATAQAIEAAAQREQLVAQVAALHAATSKIVTPRVDDATFELTLGMNGVADAKDIQAAAKQIGGLAEKELVLLTTLMALSADANRMAGLLVEAAQTPKSEFLVPLNERLVATAARLTGALETIEKAEKIKDLPENVQGLVKLSQTGGILDLRKRELGAMQTAGEALAGARAAAQELGKLVDTAALAARQAGTAAVEGSAASAAIGRQVLMAAMLGAVGVAGFVAWFLVGRGVIRRIGRLTVAMRSLADRDWSTAVPDVESADQIGEMARAVEVFKQNGIEGERLAAEAETSREREARLEAERREAERAAAEDQVRREAEAKAAEERRRQEAEAEKRAAEEHQRRTAEAARAKEMTGLAASFEEAVGGVVTAVADAAREMRRLADTLVGGVRVAADRTSVVVAASEQSSANVQVVASAAEQLAASIREISAQVQNSARASNEAVAQAQTTNRDIEGLAEAAQKIGDVVGVIQAIAAQTNLLALNATIEAARAGEAGRGFAVVASEVKNLANQTARATEQVGEQIGGIQELVKRSVDAIGRIGQTIGQVDGIAASIASAVEEQGSATQEIARNVQEASAGTQEVSENVQRVAEVNAETGAAADRVLTAAGGLAQQAETLKGEVDRFLARVRAA